MSELLRRDLLLAGLAMPAAAARAAGGPPKAEVEEILRRESAEVALLMRADGTISLIDKTNGRRWNSHRFALMEDSAILANLTWPRSERSYHEGYPAGFTARALNDNEVRVTVLGPQRAPCGQFTVSLQVEGPWVKLALKDIDEALPSLTYPPALICDSLVFPRGVGQWIRKPLPKRYFWSTFGHLNMRFFGGLSGNDGWIAILHEGYEDAGAMVTQMAASPGWVKSLGRWSGNRSVHYRLVTRGYVGVAKAFRNYAVDVGLHRSLLEKCKANPRVNALRGARILSFYQGRTHNPELKEQGFLGPDPDQRRAFKVQLSHRDVQRLIGSAQTLGAKKTLAVVRGWIAGGYDYSHPDIWPPDPRLGTVDELRKLCALREPTLVALHDNYMDIYEQSRSFANGVNRMPNGKLMAGGFWAGGQAYILNSRNSAAYAKRNWPTIQKVIRPEAYFVDTTTAVMLYESYEQGNTSTRAQDRQSKEALLQFYKQQGQVLGSEEGMDFGVPFVDWLENRHERRCGESIPLWPLVFHDAVVGARYYTKGGSASAKPFLPDLLWGYAALASVGGEAAERKWNSAAFKASLVVDDWHRQIGFAEMTSHRYLSQDEELEETQWSTGQSLIANFSNEAREAYGHVVAPGDYWIRQ